MQKNACLDKEIKHRPYLCIEMWKKNTNLDSEVKHGLYFFSNYFSFSSFCFLNTHFVLSNLFLHS